MGKKMDFDFVALIEGFRTTDRTPPFYCKLGSELIQRGYKVGFITRSRLVDRIVGDYGHTYFNLHDMIEELKGKRSISYAEEGARIEQTYDISIRNYCLAEAMLEEPHAKNDRQLTEEVIEDFILVEDFLETHKVGCIIQNQGGEIIRRVLSQVGQHRNIPSVWINWSPIRGYISLHSSELDIWDDLSRIKAFEDLATEEIAGAESYIASFRNEQEMYLHRSRRFKPWKMPLSITWGVFRELYRKYRVNQGQEPRKILRYYYFSLKMRFKGLLYDLRLPKSLDREEKFFFFPLHLPRESQLTIKAPQCLKQEAIVDIVVRSLPFGYKLYVKEHPNHIGEVPYGAIRRISKMKDVVLLHPRAHSHQLIQQSSGVIVINSTVGFESILYQKPAVVLGRPFYSRLGMTIDVEDWFHLPEALREALRLKEIHYDEVVSFISAVLKAGYKGQYGDTSEQNIEVVVDSVLTYLKRTTSGEQVLS